MAITLISTGGLFTRLGRLAKIMFDYYEYQGGSIATDVNAAIAALGTEYSLAAPLPGILATALATPNIAASVQQVAQATLCKMVNDDTPLASATDVSLAMTELIRQMKASSDSVAACTLTSSAAAGTPFTGNGAVVICDKGTDGATLDNLFAETGALLCVGDAQRGSATAGSEPFTYSGDASVADPNEYDWPGASGATASLAAVDSTVSGANLLTNSDFETFTVTNQPDNWVIASGAVTTNVLQGWRSLSRG